MPGPSTTLLIEGSFRELVEELADYIDNIKKSQADGSPNLRAEVTPLLDTYATVESSGDEERLDDARDNVLKVVVQNSVPLNSAPEKDFVAAYNLLIHLIHQSSNFDDFLQPICRNLSTDFPSSNPTRLGLALTALTTLFNTVEADNAVRGRVLFRILDVVAKSGTFANLRSQLVNLDDWFAQWEANPEQQRQLLLRIANVARDAGEGEEEFEYLVRALRTVSNGEAASDEARDMTLRALKYALVSPTKYVFLDLKTLDAVEALQNSEPKFAELLDIFTAKGLEDYNEFKKDYNGWVEKQGLDDAALVRKIRLLTLTSLAASTGQSRSLPYAAIARDLQIPAEDVEMWVIDVIRAGLVEGKLSQSTQTFLIHRTTYRLFTDSQWREVAGRLDMWKESLLGVLEVIQQEKASLIAQKEQEQRQADARVNGGGFGGFRRQQRDRERDRDREPMDMSMD